MKIFTGLDVSMASTSVCALNANGALVSEEKVPSDPGSLAEHLGELPGGGREADLPGNREARP